MPKFDTVVDIARVLKMPVTDLFEIESVFNMQTVYIKDDKDN